MATSRRSFLKGAIGVGAAAAGLSPGGAGAASPSRPNLGPIALPGLRPVPGRTPIEHVVVVMMENRSFDHFLGWLPGANGIGVSPEGSILDAERYESFVFADQKGKPHPIFHQTQLNGCGLGDQDHSYPGGRLEWNYGKMDGFLSNPANSDYSISYYLAAARTFTSPLAMHYTVCDNYFCSFLGPTWPNRFFMHAAQTDRLDNSLEVPGHSELIAPSLLPTIWDQLNQPGGPTGRYYFYDIPFLALWGAKYLPISSPVADFVVDAQAGTLANVSYIDPRSEDEGDGTSGDDHPLADLRSGDAFLSSLFHAVATGPLWDKTLFIVNYDEWGGFFDHVPPLIVTPANDYVDQVDVWRTKSGALTGVLSGMRVPCTLASPYSKAPDGPDVPRVSSWAHDHTSILRFIEDNWGLHALTPRDASVGRYGSSTKWLTSIEAALDFTSFDPSVPELPELLPFVTAGCGVPGYPQGGPSVGGEEVPLGIQTIPALGPAAAPLGSAASVAGAPRDADWRPVLSSDLIKGWR
ncbi:MAG TPA: alkaline phosphatase family protein [Acidimicrobiales bacterium]|nr:alkaline phosphatase family protein [Acidimicrobiales bacterium]